MNEADKTAPTAPTYYGLFYVRPDALSHEAIKTALAAAGKTPTLLQPGERAITAGQAAYLAPVSSATEAGDLALAVNAEYDRLCGHVHLHGALLWDAFTSEDEQDGAVLLAKLIARSQEAN